MPTSSRIAVPSDTQTLTHTGPTRKTARKILPFTRHPKLLARAARLQIQACAVRVLCLLLTTADDDGVSWVSPREICRLCPRSGRVKAYSLAQVLRSLRTLRDLGLLVWDSVPALSCFPARIEGRAVAGRGAFSTAGGRVWRVCLDAVKHAPISSSAPMAQRVLGAITYDRGTPIMHDRPSDRSPSEIFKLDPARTEPPRGPPRPPTRVSEPPIEPSSPSPSPRSEPVASETPGVADAATARIAPELAPQSREELQGGSRRANEPPPPHEPLANLEEIAAGLAFLFGPGASVAGPPRR